MTRHSRLDRRVEATLRETTTGRAPGEREGIGVVRAKPAKVDKPAGEEGAK